MPTPGIEALGPLFVSMLAGMFLPGIVGVCLLLVGIGTKRRGLMLAGAIGIGLTLLVLGRIYYEGNRRQPRHHHHHHHPSTRAVFCNK
jgi:hypothetical protein